MRYSEAKNIFDKIFKDVDGYGLARQAKEKANNFDRSLTYGEISFESFGKILKDARLDSKHKVFYDLGSGTGKAVVAASLLGDFVYLRGIEILGDLYDKSCQILSQARFPNNERRPRQIEFYFGDFLSYDLSDGDVTFVQSTCLDDCLIEKLARKLSAQKIGSKIISASYPVVSDEFEIMKVKDYKLGWGQATIYFQEKISDRSR